VSVPVPAQDRDDALALAALLARELDAGVRASLEADAPVLVLDHVVARVGRTGDDPDAPAWWGEVVLRPADGWVSPGGAPGGSEGGSVDRIPAAVGALPVGVVSGVGPHWSHLLAEAGWQDVAALAAAEHDALRRVGAAHRSRVPLVAAGRARSCALPTRTSPVPPRLAGQRLRDVLDDGPARTAVRTGSTVLEAVAAWETAARLAAVLDDAALDLTVADASAGPVGP
jgi:hypothetical protein